MAKRFLIWFWSKGGGSTFAVNLARRLSLQFGADSVRLSLRADDPALDRARALGLDVRGAAIVSDRRRPLTTLARLARSKSLLEDHAHGVDAVIVAMNFAVASPLAATLKLPLVYCAHDPAPHPGDYAPLGQIATQNFLLASAARVVALSEFAASQLRARGISRKLVVAPLASVFEPAPPRARAVGPARFLFAGRMIAYKGVELLAEAASRISARADWSLTIAGDGPALNDQVAARFALPQVERVARAWAPHEEMERLLAESDALLAPYRSATQSGVIAQAMALGTPCVATPVGALPEQVGAGGWIAREANAEAFAAAMVRALDGDRPARARAAHEAARAAWERDYWGWLAAL
jgi:glycosyltransferase involved in cell wall biosynthesis